MQAVKFVPFRRLFFIEYMRGRKPKYTPEKVAIICKAIADGETIQYACKKANISDDTFARWRANNAEFAEQLKRAEAEYNNGIPMNLYGIARNH